MKLSAARAAFPDTLPVLAGYLFLGAGFGILLSIAVGTVSYMLMVQFLF